MSSPTSMTVGLALFWGALGASYVGVAAVRRYSLRRGVLDVPSDRSSHQVPTPRGGGLAVVVAVLTMGAAGVIRAGVPGAAVATAGAALLAVATVGWVDDHRPLGVGQRLVVHVLAGLAVAGLAHVWLGSGSAGWAIGLALATWWVFWTISAINVVNFMDGIDGLIGSQLAIYAGYIATVAPAGSWARPLALTVCGASLGFLRWNWAPAAIFLGDVGSGSFGLIAVLLGLGAIAPATAFAQERSIGDAAWQLARASLPLAPLFLDAGVTIARRARAGERLTTPHRSHLYQRLANGPLGHARTAAIYAAAAVTAAAVGCAPAGGARMTVVAVYGVALFVVARRLDALAGEPRGEPSATARGPV